MDVAVVGAGSVGIAVAYYLVRRGVTRVTLIDGGAPMALTSAQSGENYRNWWPHPVMTAFTDHSISLMEEIARASGNRLRLTRRGYALATRRTSPADLIESLYEGYGATAADRIRVHERDWARSYRPGTADWEVAPDGVDVLTHDGLIRAAFGSFAAEIATVVHIRRAGDLSAQQMGQFMLEAVREAGGTVMRGTVNAIEGADPFHLRVATADGVATVRAACVVNAAGPLLADVAAMLGDTLPVRCVLQQKIAFEDRDRLVPRELPFAIDLDAQHLAWTDEERALLAGTAEGERLLARMPGGVHCRPDGGEHGRWVKLGWAYNDQPSAPEAEPALDEQFPDIVLRGAARLQPALGRLVGRLPRQRRHYGGYYTMTEENWPLIGPTRTPGAFVAGALSGYGTMAACAAGDLCAAWITGAERPDYALALSLARYDDPGLMTALMGARNKGIL